MRPLLEESITYRANGAVPKSTTRHQRGSFTLCHFFRSAGADDPPHTSKTRDDFRRYCVREARFHGPDGVQQARAGAAASVAGAKKCDVIFRS